MEMPMLRIENLHAAASAKPVLDGLSLEGSVG
jgi:hypothetical protein